MSSVDPTFASSKNVSSWDDGDSGTVADYLAGLTNGNPASWQVRCGLDPDDALRVEFPNLSTIAAGDTVSVWITDTVTFSTMAVLPYNTSIDVTTANKLTQSASVGENTFTLTQAFIDDLYDLGSGTWALRIVEDAGISGYAEIAEIDADLTTSGGGGSPGSSPGNAPDNYKYLKDDRMVRVTSISRAPQSERGWGNFVRELNKIIKNETGTFDISSTDDAKFTGFSADPATSSIWWHRYGQIVHLEFNIGTGDSDATDFTITGIPTVIRPRDDCIYPLFGLYDNGAAIASGSIKVGSDGTLTFYTDQEDGAWTGSSTKGFTSGLGVKGLMYSLRNPTKL